MSVSPDMAEDLSAGAYRLYADAEDRLLGIVARQLAASYEAPQAAVETARLRAGDADTPCEMDERQLADAIGSGLPDERNLDRAATELDRIRPGGQLVDDLTPYSDAKLGRVLRHLDDDQVLYFAAEMDRRDVAARLPEVRPDLVDLSDGQLAEFPAGQLAAGLSPFGDDVLGWAVRYTSPDEAARDGNSRDTEGEPMAEKEIAIRAVAQLADHVHWVREWPGKPTWRDRLRRWVYPERYRFDPTATPPRPWVDRPAGAYERTGWRIRAAYFGSDLAFEVEYVVCDLCEIGWVESPHSYEGYTRCGLASAALRSLRRAYRGVQWHTGGGHFRESEPFWDSVSVDVPGGYTQREGVITSNRGKRSEREHDLAPTATRVRGYMRRDPDGLSGSRTSSGCLWAVRERRWVTTATNNRNPSARQRQGKSPKGRVTARGASKLRA